MTDEANNRDNVVVENAFRIARVAAADCDSTLAPSRQQRDEQWHRLCDTDDFSRQVERQLREAFMHQRIMWGESAPTAKRGACTTRCTDAIKTYAVRVFACDSSVFTQSHLTLESAFDPETGCHLHVCAPELCAGTHDNVFDPRFHWHERTDEVRPHSPVCAEAATGGGVHWCPTHTRMHVCTRHCRMTIRNAVGFAVCVLSGRSLQGQVTASFGQGTVVLTREIEWQRNREEHERREAMAMRRSALSAVEQVVAIGSTTTLDRSPSFKVSGGAGGGGGSVLTKRRHTASAAAAAGNGTDESSSRARRDLFGAAAAAAAGNDDDGGVGDDNDLGDEEEDDDDDDSDVYVDVDEPAPDLFSERYESNTFGNDIALNLARWYAQAYAATHLLLFSDQRADIERANRQKAVDDVKHRITSYIASQRKTRQPVCMSLMRQIEQRYMNVRRIYPVLLVPTNGRCRMTAYFSLICMEFYLQLVSVVSRLHSRFDDSTRAAADALQEMTFASVSPNVLDMLHEGLKSKGQVIIEVERTLSIYPESQTVEMLGFPQKTCTEVKKTIKHCVVAAADLSEPLESLRTTHLDIVHVMYGTESIVELFLHERRLRLGIEEVAISADAVTFDNAAETTSQFTRHT